MFEEALTFENKKASDASRTRGFKFFFTFYKTQPIVQRLHDAPQGYGDFCLMGND